MSITRPLGRRRAVMLGLAVSVLLATAGAAYAIGTALSTTVIHGCFKNVAPNTLSLRTGSTCPAGTTGISWNKPGPQGIQGVQGIQGIPGPPGISGFQTVTADDAVPPGNIGTVDVACPAGDTALSGGWSVPYTATVLESHPSPTDAGVWRTAAAFPGAGGTLHITVECGAISAASAAALSKTHAPQPSHSSRLRPEGAAP